jgi:hypothetical protein
MKTIGLILSVTAAFFVSTGCERANYAKENQPPKVEDYSVCPEPEAPCFHAQKEFADGELSFRLPERIALYKTYKSEPFYAVILKTFSRSCSEFGANPAVEKERREIQRKIPARKVFAENGCAEFSAVEYDFAGKSALRGDAASDLSFIAVYAGADEAQALETLKLIRAAEMDGELKLMTARFKKWKDNALSVKIGKFRRNFRIDFGFRVQ